MFNYIGSTLDTDFELGVICFNLKLEGRLNLIRDR
jgi:hypothetical protein